MKGGFNFKVSEESEWQIPVTNRAFQYNDGIFETMLFTNGETRFLELHLNRVKRAAEVLQVELQPEFYKPEAITEFIKDLITENKLTGNIRIKLKVWRSGAGLYSPNQNQAESLITVSLQPTTSNIIESADFAATVSTHFTPYAFFKGPNSIQYVLAGIEKQQRNLDEIILLSAEGFVSECLVSNVLWLKDDTVFTPSIATGCIAGIMREHLLSTFSDKGVSFQEGKFLPEELLKADTVFTSNVTGIRTIKRIGETIFKDELPDFLTKAVS